MTCARQGGLGRWLILVAVVGAGLGCERNDSSGSAANGGAASATPKLPTYTMTVGGESFVAELAFQQATRRRGMAGRRDMGANEAMLFVFRRSRVREFWMKGCYMDLDIAFIQADGVITKVATMIAPPRGDARTTYSSELPVRYALEMRAGTADRLGLQAGDTVEIPQAVKNIIADPDESSLVGGL